MLAWKDFTHRLGIVANHSVLLRLLLQLHDALDGIGAEQKIMLQSVLIYGVILDNIGSRGAISDEVRSVRFLLSPGNEWHSVAVGESMLNVVPELKRLHRSSDSSGRAFRIMVYFGRQHRWLIIQWFSSCDGFAAGYS